MVMIKCSDDGGDCDTMVSELGDLRVGKRCPTCDSLFSHEARQALMVEDKSSVRIKCSDGGGDCGTILESFDELRVGKRCPVCDSIVTHDTRQALME